MNLAIDIGNSSIKCALIDNGEVREVKRLVNLQDLSSIIKEFDAASIAICSVHYSQDQIIEALPKLKEAFYLTSDSKTPIGLSYDTPHTLGMDRLAAAIGAWDIFPENPVMIIDIGSCITYDLVVDAQYLGGLIAPGIDLRYKSMHDYTANLPLLKDRDAPNFIGRSTDQSMRSGVINGIVGEIDHHISQLLLKYPDLKVIMTGGDAQLFESKINSDIFVALEIVQLGLNRVLKENV